MSDIRFNQWLHQSGTGGVSQSDGGHVGIGTTNPLIPVGAGNTHILNVGVVTCNNIYGSGANITGVVKNIVEDTSPQLGADLDTNSHHILLDDSHAVKWGDNSDLQIEHDGNHSYINEQGTGDLFVQTNGGSISFQKYGTSERLANFITDGAVELFYDSSKKFESTNTGAIVTGILTATSRVSLGNNTTNAVDLEFGTNRGSAGDTLANINWKWNNTYVAQIRGMAGSDTTNKDDAHLNFYTASAGSLVERLRIDSSGNMNFQNSSTSSTADLSSIIFNNGVGEVAKIRSETRNGNNYGMITFHNNVNGTSAEKFRLNHDGGFCYGTDSSRTAEFTQPDGFSIRYDDKGQFQTSVTNTTCGLINRKGSDGDILSFRKDGTGVGHIGVTASTMYLNFNASSVAANQLDDYEEGTWTPAVAFDVGGGGISYGSRAGSYVKIGRMVHLQYYMVISSGVSSSDYFARLALPFTGIGVQHQDARIRQWNSGNSDWFVSLGGNNPVFFKNNSTGGGGTWARGDSVNGQVLSGQYILYV